MNYKVVGIRITGVLYALISAGLGLVAVNSGNNLMYLITTMLLGFLLSSGVAGRRNLYSSKLSVTFPDEIYAEEQCAINVSVTNKKHSVSLFLISVEFGKGEAFFPVIRYGQTLEGAIFTKFNKRGRYNNSLFYITSIYPFNLFKRYRHIYIDGSFAVFPSPYKCSPDAVFMRDDHEDNDDAEKPGLNHNETDIVGIRPYEEGDSIRRIHWKSSAKTGKWNTKLYEGESAGVGRIIELDRIISAGVEKGLSMASYVISESIKSGVPIGMLIQGVIIPPAAERSHKLKLLEMLADYHE
ncbi:MAG: DUF58 domain-containing protein [Synergistaceae bacterium]|nr:DUF58 domain-containing protein [Synergistaceae bacterium]